MITSLDGRRFGILGMGRSGIGAARLITRLGGTALISDMKPAAKLAKQIASIASDRVDVETGTHQRLLAEPFNAVIVSPGAVLAPDWLRSWSGRGIEVISELEFAWRCSSGNAVMVTGSNGKTTTVTLIETILLHSGIKAIAVGNIGTAWSEHLPAPEEMLYVVEVSSYQLEHAPTIKPKVAALINVLENHLDRHGTLEEYGKTKLRLFANQNSDSVAVMNRDDEFSVSHMGNVPGKISWFGQHPTSEWNVRENHVSRGSQDGERVLIRENEWTLPGRHNLMNAAAAAAACSALGLTDSQIRAGLLVAKPVEHRIEFVREYNGVRFYNDSKSTNLAATMTAIAAVPSPIILLFGGRAKKESFAPLSALLDGPIHLIIAFGEAREKILHEVGPHARLFSAETMSEALRLASAEASAGDSVLLSPGCASFDQFDNFEKRGEVFKSLVMSL